MIKSSTSEYLQSLKDQKQYLIGRINELKEKQASEGMPLDEELKMSSVKYESDTQEDDLYEEQSECSVEIPNRGACFTVFYARD